MSDVYEFDDDDEFDDEDEDGDEGRPAIFYTVEEARALLPSIIPHVRAIQKQALHFRAVQAAVKAASGGLVLADGNLTADPFYEEDAEATAAESAAFDTAVEELRRLGIDVKDPDRGLIDFYSWRDGEVVYLCFELGEETITHWHPVDGGYAARRPI